MFLCLRRRLKRRNAWLWRFKQRFKHRNASGFGVFDIYGSHCKVRAPRMRGRGRRVVLPADGRAADAVPAQARETAVYGSVVSAPPIFEAETPGLKIATN